MKNQTTKTSQQSVTWADVESIFAHQDDNLEAEVAQIKADQERAARYRAAYAEYYEKQLWKFGISDEYYTSVQ